MITICCPNLRKNTNKVAAIENSKLESIMGIIGDELPSGIYDHKSEGVLHDLNIALIIEKVSPSPIGDNI